MISRPLRKLASRRIFYYSRLYFSSNESGAEGSGTGTGNEPKKEKEPLIRSARTPAGRTHRLIEDLSVEGSALQMGHFDENDPKVFLTIRI